MLSAMTYLSSEHVKVSDSRLKKIMTSLTPKHNPPRGPDWQAHGSWMNSHLLMRNQQVIFHPNQFLSV